ncbi:hypothetical protein [Methylobacterium brachythecii]|uniref:Uncharacterized protein n=1 Tax=Methylobacterium brachythecii TaxID=1176177 RepID=A0A7W6AJ48_9HYPH|nr:hypothetical protein [Methylobacterium brachythecii]MBB3900812.1 hypothetical protein [Methylobacterium brachythecii]GLS46033.1 hypothetical protein GCM10007884_40240 [Methylobacterium brachythecii]
MAVESWITPEETPALAEAAMAVIEGRLSRISATEREAYWASIRKAYNTPYNPPASKRSAKTAQVSVIAISTDALPAIEVQAAALAASALPAEIQAA